MNLHRMIGGGADTTLIGDDAGLLRLRVTAIRYLAETIREIELRHPDGRVLPPATPGAHIDLQLPGELSRSYSLVNATGEADRYLIAVNRDAASRGGSAYLCENLRVGTLLDLSTPQNTFPLVESRASVFFAGGIGITPIISMIRALTSNGRSWELFYAARSRAAAAYLPELRSLAEVAGGHLRFHDDASAGRVMDIPKLVESASVEAHLYCCGPAQMIDAFEAAAARTRDRSQIHIERFANKFEVSRESFKVFLKRKGVELVVPAGQTIMQVLQDNGFRVAYSCREGVCGTCETRVLEGEPDHRDRVLSERERASNKVMMICCSGSKSSRLVLDI